MISSLRGKLMYLNNSEIIIEVNGVGYNVHISKKLFSEISSTGSEISLFTYLDVKENSLQLYGFFDLREKEIFRLLLTVNGIGTKLAHTMLWYLTFEEILSLIINKSSFTKVPGVSSKKIELISLTLKDKIFKIEKGTELINESTYIKDDTRTETMKALISLGYLRSDAEKIIREVLKNNDGKEFTTEELIKNSLEFITK
ncbi:Holliday junction branch migration protein RuvA [soil metagenome]